MNGLTLLAMIALAVGVIVAYRAGLVRGRRASIDVGPHPLSSAASAPPPPAPAPTAPAVVETALASPHLLAPEAAGPPLLDVERARLIRSYEAEIGREARRRAALEAERCGLRALDEDRRALLAEVAQAKAETARYRQLVVDAENDAPSAFLGGPGSSDDLKMIVGVGPMLERMLHQLGVTTFRQIARWTERDVEEFDRRLPEFPGRIRRDTWVTQARELHQSKYGSPP